MSTIMKGTEVIGGFIPSVVKEATFSGTTNMFGHIEIDSNTNHVVVGACVNGGYINYPFKYSANLFCYLHVMNEDGTSLANTAVTGNYYYLELK